MTKERVISFDSRHWIILGNFSSHSHSMLVTMEVLLSIHTHGHLTFTNTFWKVHTFVFTLCLFFHNFILLHTHKKKLKEKCSLSFACAFSCFAFAKMPSTFHLVDCPNELQVAHKFLKVRLSKDWFF
jgi:hypothetical protein